MMMMKKYQYSLKATLLMAVTMSFQVQVSAQSVYINMGKGWSYITGAQRAVNDSNRVNYLIGTEAPFGKRVNNFRDMEMVYGHDSEFLDAHVSAAEVYESSKTVDGPAFFYLSNGGEQFGVSKVCGVMHRKVDEGKSP